MGLSLPLRRSSIFRVCYNHKAGSGVNVQSNPSMEIESGGNGLWALRADATLGTNYGLHILKETWMFRVFLTGGLKRSFCPGFDFRFFIQEIRIPTDCDWCQALLVLIKWWCNCIEVIWYWTNSSSADHMGPLTLQSVDRCRGVQCFSRLQ